MQDGLAGALAAHRRFDHTLSEPKWYDRWMCLAIDRAIIDGYRARTQSRRSYRPSIVPIETVIVDGDGEPLRLGDTLAATDTADGLVDAEDLERWLRVLTFDDPADRRILDKMLDGMLLQDIAASEGVHPTRISQRVRKIRERLTEAL